MEDPASPSAARLASAAQILDRALGRPKQSVEVEIKGRSLEEMLYAIHEARENEQAQARTEKERLATKSE